MHLIYLCTLDPNIKNARICRIYFDYFFNSSSIFLLLSLLLVPTSSLPLCVCVCVWVDCILLFDLINLIISYFWKILTSTQQCCECVSFSQRIVSYHISFDLSGWVGSGLFLPFYLQMSIDGIRIIIIEHIFFVFICYCRNMIVMIISFANRMTHPFTPNSLVQQSILSMFIHRFISIGGLVNLCKLIIIFGQRNDKLIYSRIDFGFYSSLKS